MKGHVASDTISQISLIIAVKDDVRIFDCLKSIDEDVEVIVSCNGSTSEFVDMLSKRDGISVVSECAAGIGRAYNVAIARASGNFIFLMDSDCVFASGSIRRMAEALSLGSMVKGRVVYRSGRSWSSRVATSSRQYHADLRPSSYSPPLVYDRQIVKRMGNCHFHDAMRWREDREFELRRRRYGIQLVHVESAVIYHPAMSMRQDLRSLFSYGVGEAIGRRHGLLPRGGAGARLAHTLAKSLVLLRNRMWGVAAYYLVRRGAFR